MAKYRVTLIESSLRHVFVEVTAKSEDRARRKVEKMLEKDGLIDPEMGDNGLKCEQDIETIELLP